MLLLCLLLLQAWLLLLLLLLQLLLLWLLLRQPLRLLHSCRWLFDSDCHRAGAAALG